MSWTTIILQLGISALVIFAVYKIALRLIDRWSENESRRTEAMAAGFEGITGAHREMVTTLNQSHREIVTLVNAHQQTELQILKEHQAALTGLDIKISTAMDLTPVRGISRPDISAMTAEGAIEDTPVERPARAPTHPGTAWGPIRPSSKR